MKNPPASLICWTAIILGLVLRFIGIHAFELIGDEPLYIVRAIGWVDTLSSDIQTTPIDWLVPLPRWATWSFHDHPPGVFAIFHLGAKFFGSSLEVFRLISALGSVAAIWLTMQIGRILWNKTAALVAGALMALNTLVLFYGRVALMESLAMCTLLAVIYVLLKYQSHKHYLSILALTFGLAILTKYVALFLIPTIAWWFWHTRTDKTKKQLAKAIVLFLLILSPVIIYNAGLYQSVGHFDLQFASLFAQEIPQWTDLPGKDSRGTVTNRLIGITQLGRLVSPIFLFLFISAVALLGLSWKEHKPKEQQHFLLVITLIASWIAFVGVSGAAARFLVYGIPFMILLISGVVTPLSFAGKRQLNYILAIVLIFEVGFAVNTLFLQNEEQQIGPKNIAYASGLHVRDYGVQALEVQIQKILDGQVPVLRAGTSNQTLNAYITANAQQHALAGGSPRATILLYDPRAEIRTIMWVFSKRTLYEGWPVIGLQTLPQFLTQIDVTELNQEVLYVHTEEGTIRIDPQQWPIDPDDLKTAIESAAIKPLHVVKTNRGVDAFSIYSFPSSLLPKLIQQ